MRVRDHQLIIGARSGNGGLVRGLQPRVKPGARRAFNC